MQRKNIYFILLRPNFLGNIGSVARVLKNFEFENLRLVNPPKNYKDAEARRMAVGAFDLLKTSQVFTDLKDALEDIDLAIGTTCGYQRACQSTSLNTISSQLSKSSRFNKIAIIFGDERDGMSREELECCQHIISVPTNRAFPSLNIAQALGIIAYELCRETEAIAPFDEDELLALGADTEAFFASCANLLNEIGFTRSFNKKSVMAEFRALYQRATPSLRELQLLHGALRKMEQHTRASITKIEGRSIEQQNSTETREKKDLG